MKAGSLAHGDEVTINNSVPSKYAYQRFPDKAIVVDVFPGTTFLAQDTSHEATPVDCVIRCQAPFDGRLVCHLVHSHYLIPYEDAAAEESGGRLPTAPEE